MIVERCVEWLAAKKYCWYLRWRLRGREPIWAVRVALRLSRIHLLHEPDGRWEMDFRQIVDEADKELRSASR